MLKLILYCFIVIFTLYNLNNQYPKVEQNQTICNQTLCQPYINNCTELCSCDQSWCWCCMPCINCLGLMWNDCCSCFGMC